MTKFGLYNQPSQINKPRSVKNRIVALTFESIFCFVLEASRPKARNELLSLAETHEDAAPLTARTIKKANLVSLLSKRY